MAAVVELGRMGRAGRQQQGSEHLPPGFFGNFTDADRFPIFPKEQPPRATVDRYLSLSLSLSLCLSLCLSDLSSYGVASAPLATDRQRREQPTPPTRGAQWRRPHSAPARRHLRTGANRRSYRQQRDVVGGGGWGGGDEILPARDQGESAGRAGGRSARRAGGRVRWGGPAHHRRLGAPDDQARLPQPATSTAISAPVVCRSPMNRSR